MSEQTYAPPEQQQPSPSSRPAKLGQLVNQLCPNCSTGVLQVTTYDPDAQYAQGQGDALANPAVAAYTVLCGHCTFGESRPIPTVTQSGRAS